MHSSRKANRQLCEGIADTLHVHIHAHKKKKHVHRKLKLKVHICSKFWFHIEYMWAIMSSVDTLYVVTKHSISCLFSSVLVQLEAKQDEVGNNP